VGGGKLLYLPYFFMLMVGKSAIMAAS